MSNFELPEHVNPYQLADKSSELNGVVDAKRLKRLEDASEGVTMQATAELSFTRDESNRRIISGHVKGAVNVQCQRCLEDFSYALEGDFLLALVYNDEMAKALPEHLDSLLLLPDELLDVASIVEDELLLCLPLYPAHPEGECRIKTQFGTVGPDAEMSAKKAPNPFDILKDLK